MAKKSNRLLALDIFLIIIFIGANGLGLYIYYSNPQTTVSVSQGLGVGNGPIEYDIAYNFTSDVFAAQHGIGVSVIVSVDPTAQNNASLYKPKFIYMYFPGSVLPNPSYCRHGSLCSQTFVLPNVGNGVWRNSTTLTYRQAGPTCSFVYFAPVNFTRDCNVTIDSNLITIEPSDSLYQFQTNKTTTALALVVFAFTAILIRDVIIEIGENFSTGFK